MADIDLHTHSRFFHMFPGRPTWYDEIGIRNHITMARARGLDAIAVTNHDYHTDFDLDTDDLAIIPGIEISSTEGHMLVVGPDPPEVTKPNRITPPEVIELARERNCAVIMAHPFRNSRIKETDADVDAVEVNGKRSQSPHKIEELAAEKGLPLVGGSDAHYPIEIGRTFTEMDIDSVTPERVVDAIKKGNTEYRITSRFPDEYMKQLYSVIHRLKGHTTGGSEPAGTKPAVSKRPQQDRGTESPTRTEDPGAQQRE